MPTGELDPDNPNVVEYGPTGDSTVTVDLSDEDVIDVELFGAAGSDGGSGGGGGEGGRVIGRDYDVADVDEITLQIADGQAGYGDGGSGATSSDGRTGGDGGGLTVVQRGGDVDLAAHGGGGGYDFGRDEANGPGGGGSSGGSGATSSDGTSAGDGLSPLTTDLGGDGGIDSNSSAEPGAGHVLTESRFGSTDTFLGGGRSVHEALARIRFPAETEVEITGTNSPVAVGAEVEVQVDVTNLGPEREITVELEADPA